MDERTETLRVPAGERTTSEVLAELRRGDRVVIEVEMMGITSDVVVRENRGTYYCDTPVKLLTYETAAGLRRCLERFRMTKPE